MRRSEVRFLMRTQDFFFVPRSWQDENIFLCLSGIYTLHFRIRRSEVRFLMGTQNFFFVPRSWQDEKTSFLILHRAQNLPSLLFCQKHYAIDIADPSSMQDACHMNFVIDLAHRGVSVAQWLEHRNAESEGLRFDTSWGLRIFSLSHARDKTKNIFLYFFTELKTYHLSYFYLQTLRYRHCWS